ncbi:hypothetical protein [Paenibacillus turpanensis]|uniref:hypothetical protein n=1 Tax=Paenibacillus turpanensis TaxID=2689078 RepID=UPI0014079ABD|nr:hypothetical protein [Paenibacillus turpanensis]
MSLPNVPDITPDIQLTRKEAVNLLLTSIAMEEIGMSHLLNAEGEKIQHVLAQQPTARKLLQFNRGTERLLRNLVKKEMLLQYKMENVLDLERLAEEKEEEYEEFE